MRSEPTRDTPLRGATDNDLDILERRIAEERQRRLDEEAENAARYKRDGCKIVTGHSVDTCAACRNEVGPEHECPYRAETGLGAMGALDESSGKSARGDLIINLAR
jgi:hypothetical protein